MDRLADRAWFAGGRLMKQLLTNTEFVGIVRRLREIDPRWRFMAVFAAEFWSDERLEAAAVNGNADALFGRPGELAPDRASVQ
jgi:hypothetical protein